MVDCVETVLGIDGVAERARANSKQIGRDLDRLPIPSRSSADTDTANRREDSPFSSE